LVVEWIGGLLYVVPFAMLLTGVRTTLNFWVNRKGYVRALGGAQ
jgi:hypothetical protein